MRVHLTTLEFDLAGAVTIDVLASSEMGNTTRRMNRIPTLDGGVAVNDFGFTEADRTITLRWRPVSKEHEASIVRLVQLYGRLNLSCPEGLFRVAPETYRPTPNESTLILFALEKLA